MLSLDEIIFEEEAHTYTFRNKVYDSVTQVIKIAGLGADFSMVPPDRLEWACQRGTFVHLATQYYDEGRLDMKSVHPALQGYVEAYIRFRSEKPITVIATERRMVNVPFALAGTPDLICWMNGVRCVIDKKTSQNMHKSMGLQTAGYMLLWNWEHTDKIIERRYGLRLEKTGRYKLVPHEDPEDVRAFMDAKRHAESTKHMTRWVNKYAA